MRRLGLARTAASAYLVARVAGLLVMAYVVWLMASLRVLTYQRSMILVAGLVTIVGGIRLCRGWRDCRIAEVRHSLRVAVGLESMGLVLYVAYLCLRSRNPEIFGTERMMDMALLTGAGKTDVFPFADPWFAMAPVNYYYYGSYVASLVANLSHTSYVTAYACMLALVFSTTALLAGCVVYEHTGRMRFALLAGFLVTGAGTPFFASCTFRAWWAGPPASCAWTSSTRLFSPSYIINEIPSYSFTVGDLHAHVLGLPIFLVALILMGWLHRVTVPQAGLVSLLALVLASAAMTNSWDTLTLALLLALVAIERTVRRRGGGGWRCSLAREWRWLTRTLAAAAVALLAIVPFLHSFHPPVGGVGLSLAYVRRRGLFSVQYPTPFPAWFGLWGLFLVGLASAAWAARGSRDRVRERAAFPWLLAGCGVCLIVLVEVIYLPDIYSLANPPFFRANTVFKFGYHAWVLLALALPALAANTLEVSPDLRRWGVVRRSAPTAVLLVSAACGVVYPVQALVQNFGVGAARPHDHTLDGMAFMRRVGHGDYEAISFLAGMSRERAVVVEAAGDSYQYFGRVSAFSGLSAPVNWLTHEWGWRSGHVPTRAVAAGQLWGQLSATAADVGKIYETSDVREASRLLAQFHARYVYVGPLEQATYPRLTVDKFSEIGTLIYHAGGVRIYDIELSPGIGQGRVTP